MDSFCPLFVFKILLERIVLPQDSAPQDTPLTARIQFLDLPPIDAASSALQPVQVQRLEGKRE